MALPADVARGRNIVARWCNLAERRLEHLTELFETWRDLLNREASLENTAIDLTWLGRRRTTQLPRDTGYRQPVVRPKPPPAPIVATPPVAVAPRRDIPADVLVALKSRLAVADEAPSVPDAPTLDEMPLQPLDLDTMKERYPLLRNML